MIARLNGKVLEKHPNRVIVDVAGVGYDVQVPLSTFYGCGDPGAAIALRIHTHVREDQLALYGFATELELAMFEKLIAVSGIGPKLALSVLSGIEPRELAGAIQRNDLARLTAIPGVGKKTAERICVELRDSISFRILDMIGKNAGAFGTGHHAIQLLLEVVSVKNVVPEYEAGWAVVDECFADHKSLCKAIR